MFLPSNITLKFGDSGDFVSELQRRLSAVHCFSGDANGFFDGVTVNGVSQFQSMSGIRADGIAGPETLRRLNGVISGDTSSSTDHKAEEERKAQEAANLQLAQKHMIAEQNAALAQPTYQQPAAEVVPQQSPQLAEVNYAQTPAYEPQQQAQQQPQPQQHPTVNPADHLAQMMMIQQQQQMSQQQMQPDYTQPQAGNHHLAAQPQAAQAHLQATHAQAPVINLAPAAPVVVIAPQQPAAAVAQQPAVPAPEQPRGIVGRAIQFASEKLQQLASHFESKLRPDVIDEVKNIGAAMAKSGVREVAIPTGPEPQRGVESPARGQQQVPQRS